MKTKLFLTLMTIVSLTGQKIKAQVNTDGFFNKKGEANIAVSFTTSSFEKFYFGETVVDAVPDHNKIDQSIYNLYVNYGITDKFTLIANLPYIQAKGNGAPDPVNGTTEQSDIQDLSLMVKYALFEKQHDGGKIIGIATFGGSLPLGYEPSGILSIGNGASSIDAKLGLQYNDNSRFFGNVFLGYSLRGQSDNNFGLGTGAQFDVPNSLNAQVKLGYAGKSFYADAWFDAQKSNGNLDIGGAGFFGNFPETTVNYSRIGLNLYVPLTKIIGISGGAGTVVSGRNVGKVTYYSGGLVIGLGR